MNRLPSNIPFGYWKGPDYNHQFSVGINHLIFLNLTSLIRINSDIGLLRTFAQEKSNKDLLLDGDSMDSDSVDTQIKRIEESFLILESKGVSVHKKIKDRKDFFSFLSLHSFYGGSFSGIVILKAVEVGQTSPEALQRDLVLPEHVSLVPAKMAYQIAFLMSHFITENFMKVFDLSRIIIMNEPLEKTGPDDDNLTVEISPPSRTEGLIHKNAEIRVTIFNNPYTINKGDGLCFLCFQSTIKDRT